MDEPKRLWVVVAGTATPARLNGVCAQGWVPVRYGDGTVGMALEPQVCWSRAQVAQDIAAWQLANGKEE